MTTYGLHASHEQFPPSRLLALAVHAEQAGFDAVHSSDHLAPWLPGGEAGHAWAWLGAAMGATRLPFGLVTAPGYRQHPAVVAQAVATLAEMFPGRLSPALGSGEALNEHVTGARWPAKPERNARLAECAQVIRALLAGERVDHDGLVVAHDARLWSLPRVVPPLRAAAMTPGTAHEVAAWADGLVTVGCRTDDVGPVIEAYRDAGGLGPVHVQVHLALAASHDEAVAMAQRHWRLNALPPSRTQELRTPEDVAAATAGVAGAALEQSVLCAGTIAELEQPLLELGGLGVDQLLLHHVGPDQESFVDAAGSTLLPRLRSSLPRH